MKRKEFLVLYDYGQGGLWALVRADSADEGRQRFPEVQVFDERPTAVSTEMLGAIRSANAVDIDGPVAGWLAEFDADLLAGDE